MMKSQSFDIDELIAAIEAATGPEACEARKQRRNPDEYTYAIQLSATRAAKTFPDDLEAATAFGVVRFAIYCGVRPTDQQTDALAAIERDRKAAKAKAALSEKKPKKKSAKPDPVESAT